MSNDSFTFNATASGQAQVNQGQTVNATQTNHVAGELTVAKFFEAIEVEVKNLPEVQQQEIKQAVEPLKKAVTNGQPPAEPVRATLLDKLRPHGAFIAKCLIAFSEPVLAKLQETDPTGVIAGVLAVAKEVKNR